MSAKKAVADPFLLAAEDPDVTLATGLSSSFR
jgi:hypothetical protein